MSCDRPEGIRVFEDGVFVGLVLVGVVLGVMGLPNLAIWPFAGAGALWLGRMV